MYKRHALILILTAALAEPLLWIPGWAHAGEVQRSAVAQQIREQGEQALDQLNHRLVRIDWQRRAARDMANLLVPRALVARAPLASTKRN